MSKEWKVEESNFNCSYRFYDGGFSYCVRADTESQHCKEETCPIKIKEAKEG